MTQPATSRRPRAERGDYRANHIRLIDAAFAVFDDTDIEAPLSAVAQRAGVGEATLYRHFAGKDELVLEMYAIAMTRVEQRVLAALAVPGQDAAARLDAFFDAMVGALARHRSYPQLAVRGARIRPGRSGDPRVREALRALVAEGKAAGLLEDDVLAADLVTLALTSGTLAADATPATEFGWKRHLALGRRGLAPADAVDRDQALAAVAVPAWLFEEPDDPDEPAPE
ncbi:TetR/AcrR family transcriptional regulator [Demequina rhizosphaerae]|uniref:TetR/AcrR family transcriptional regulator n=1 Tax=Demequina rhizosphaerae TaxID=1638985 RepID=UPI0007846044|nr:TetR/AcrR family transcriptional regulator [Demequina rhizosphaerae]